MLLPGVEDPAMSDLRDYRGLYEAPRAMYRPTHQVHTPLHNGGQDILTDNTMQWTMQYNGLDFLTDNTMQWTMQYNGQDFLTDNTSILACQSEHFQSLISANCHMLETAIHHIPQHPVKQELDTPPTLNETIEATGHP